MKTTINYFGLKEPAKSRKALKDIERYLGKKKMNLVIEALTGLPKKTIIANLSLFVGIDGFPALAFADKYGVDD